MRGCQRKVIYLKNTGSPIFEEAYFFLRKDGGACEEFEGYMVGEATRIIENFVSAKGRERERKFPKKGVFLFLLGFLFGAVAEILIFVI